MTNWTDIHPDFRYYQQTWEQQNLTYQDAQEWIPLGFTPNDYWIVEFWKNYFTSQKAKTWIDIGLSKKDYEVIAAIGPPGLTRLRFSLYRPSSPVFVDSFAGLWIQHRVLRDGRYPEAHAGGGPRIKKRVSPGRRRSLV